MVGLRVGADLLVRGSTGAPARFAHINLIGAVIDGNFIADGISVRGPLHLRELQIKRSLLLRSGYDPRDLDRKRICLNDVDLSYANVSGTLELSYATVHGRLRMRGLRVGQTLFLESGPKDERVSLNDDLDLSYAKISGSVEFNRGAFAKRLILDKAEIDASLNVIDVNGGCEHKGLNASIQLARIGENANVEKSIVANLDFSGTIIAGQLRLQDVQWTQDGRLLLRNAHVSTVDMESRGWPKPMALHGLTYDRIGGEGEAPYRDLDRETFRSRYVGWLEHDPIYTPQPYEQLADVFRKAGEPERAAYILYESRERARQKARSWRY